ncbi:uncharacterized protein C2845_PM15G21340 [Panicum miliaceum]|uniref:Uncharacterized protein n=1 Tax=Panicum miliaceum TaxID=4540 RepID=A0A3L6Q6U6_PANMI|nr:uncharacterized protein C2845_PM15G21340 [Panicum miliaceum]
MKMQLTRAPDPVEDALADLFGTDHEVIPAMKAVLEQRKRKREIMKQALLLGMYYYTYLEKKLPRVAKESGIEWVQKTLGNETSCYNMFRMNAPVFEMLHDVLVQSYGLKSTIRMSSREALGMFLWMIGPPEPVRQAENKFTRSMETISQKFEHVLECVCNLAKDIIRPRYHTFSTVHPKISNHKYAPFFNNAIVAIDGTHVKVIVPGKKVGPYFNRSKEKSQNVLAICDFDKRFTYVAAGIPGSAHDWTVLQEAMQRQVLPGGLGLPEPPGIYGTVQGSEVPSR